MANLLPERWREPLENVQERIGSFLERWVPKRNAIRSPENISAESMPELIQRGGPRLDMAETPDGLMVTAEVPGIGKDDISIELNENRLTLRGEKKICREENKGNLYQSECRYGSFTRSIELPYEVDDKNIKAYLQNGILTIRLARSTGTPSPRYRVPIT